MGVSRLKDRRGLGEICIDAPSFGNVDALVDREMVELTARYLLDSRSEPSFEYKTNQTYYDDARTALFEALTASGHLSQTEITGTLPEIHEQMISVLCNAYHEALPGFERERRFLELCEELTVQAIEVQIAEGRLSSATQLATISDIPSEIPSVELTKLGYRTKNNKGMTRSRHLVDNQNGTYTRITEQVSRSNSNGVETEAILTHYGVNVRHCSARPEARVLGTQLLHEMEEGVIGIQRVLDTYKDHNIRYGEILNDDQLEYNELRSESLLREQQAEAYISQLALYMQQLDLAQQAGSITSYQHLELLATEVHRILQAICVMRPEYVEDCFGDDSVDTYIRAAQVAATGDVAGAARIVESGSVREQTVTFCGMSISTKSTEGDVAPDSLSWLLQLGLEVWPTRIGSCRVPECVSPRQTEVGPCDVCIGQCQPLFDKGWSLGRISRFYRSLKNKSGKLVERAATIWDLFKPSGHKSVKRETM